MGRMGQAVGGQHIQQHDDRRRLAVDVGRRQPAQALMGTESSG
jgi:hypothetical protein